MGIMSLAMEHVSVNNYPEHCKLCRQFCGCYQTSPVWRYANPGGLVWEVIPPKKQLPFGHCPKVALIPFPHLFWTHLG